MMGFDRIDHGLRFFVLTAEICTELYMRAFHFVVDCFAYIVREDGIVRYSDDIRKYAEQALSPAKLASVTIVSEERKELLVLVAPEQLSLAIGRSGQNVRLTTKLIGWKVDIKRSDEVQEQRAAENFQSLVEQQIDLLASQLQCTHDVAAVLVSSGYLTPEGVAEPEVSYLAESTGFSEEFAQELWNAAAAAKAAAAGLPAEEPADTQSGETPDNAF